MRIILFVPMVALSAGFTIMWPYNYDFFELFVAFWEPVAFFSFLGVVLEYLGGEAKVWTVSATVASQRAQPQETRVGTLLRLL